MKTASEAFASEAVCFLAAGPRGGRLAESDASITCSLILEFWLFVMDRRGRRSLQSMREFHYFYRGRNAFENHMARVCGNDFL